MIVGVIGSGAIGPDLAYGFVSALAREPDSRVYLHDIKQEALDRGVARIRKYVRKGLARGKLDPRTAAAIEERLVPTLDIADLADCDYVLEAASEDLDVKRAILANLEAVVRPDCLVGFATSGLPRRWIAAEAKHPERCFVNHPFFPAWRSLPIEVVLSGDAEMERRMLATLRRLGKVPVVTADVPCFAADDIFCNYINEAARIVEEGIATPAQVDKVVDDAIRGGGPFNVMDGTKGNLLTVHCQQLMMEAPTGSEWFRPVDLLVKQGDRPWHDRAHPGDPRTDEATARTVLDRILAVLFARTFFCVDHGVCAPRELNWLTRMALGFRSGLLDLAAEIGMDRVAGLCEAYAAEHPGFEVPESIRERRMPDFFRDLEVERGEDGIAVVSIWRPEVKGALSRRTIEELDRALAELEAEDSVRAIVLTSWDGSLAGADINELAALDSPEACEAICHAAHPVLSRLSRMDKPTVAAVDGPVLGGGAELCMCAKARVVGPRLLLGQPEVNLGIIPGYGGTQRLPRLVGFENAWRMLRTGAPIGARQAAEWGWANEVAEDFVGAAKALARAAADGEVELRPVDEGPVELPDELPEVDIGHHSLAIDAILVDVVLEGLRLPLEEGLAVEARGFGRCKRTRDLNIGMVNFMVNGPRVPAEFLNE